MIAPCLKPGGTIGVCSPSHIARREEYRELLDTLRGLGFRVKEADNLYSDAYGYGAPPEARAADFNQLIRDPEVELVMFGGGEGGNELLPLIDFDEIRRQPKRILSYSDSTTILGAVWALTGLEVYYGQSPGHFRGISDYNLRNFRAFLMGDAPEHIASGPWRVQTGGVGEKAGDGLRRGFLPEHAHVQIPVPLAQPPPVRADQQREMAVGGDGVAKLLQQPDLPGRGGKQVPAPHHAGDAHGPVVCRHGQLIGVDAVRAAEDEVAALAL